MDSERSARPLRVAITLGDPAGVGPEIILRLFAQEGGFGGLSERCSVGVVPFVVGESRFLEETARIPEVQRAIREDAGAAAFEPVIRAVTAPPTEPSPPGTICVVEPRDFVFDGARAQGKVSAQCGAAAYAYVRHAVALVQSGGADAVVTAPLNKEALRHAGCHYPGHTEMLSDLAGGVPVAMLLAGGGLRVALATIHEPLAYVPVLLSGEKILWHLRLMNTFIPWFGLPPRDGGGVRIGVCGLNPHAGESGMFGDEERGIIAPAVAQARAEGIDAAGPLPADTVFHFHREGRYDAVLAMYHDQALIPVKTLAFHEGVNVTMGLPFIRTSVDHGTAFDIAGKGIARAGSLRAAVECAAVLVRNQRAAGSPQR